jgi:serine/threonine protein kinase
MVPNEKSLNKFSASNGEYCYDIQDELGRGAFGCVYKGFNKLTKEVIAIKLVNIVKLLLESKSEKIV